MLRFLWLFLLCSGSAAFSQSSLGKLTVEKIMRDPKWIGSSPGNVGWSADSKYLYFNWNPDNAPGDSLYFITRDNKTPVKASYQQRLDMRAANRRVYNTKQNAYLYANDGDIFFTSLATGKTIRIIETTEAEYNPQFSFNDTKIVYTRSQNLYAWDISTGQTTQLTRIQAGSGGNRDSKDKNDKDNEQEKWLRNDQLAYFEVLRERKAARDAREAYAKALPKEKELRQLGIGDKSLQNLVISNNGRFISYSLYKSVQGNKGTFVPSFVTESGFTTELSTRTKVGEMQGSSELYIYDRVNDSLYTISADKLPGIKDLPDYVKDYPDQLAERTKKAANRSVDFASATWSPDGNYLLVDIRSKDNKDRWLAIWSATTGELKSMNRQRDEAWIGGPGSYNRGWITNETAWFQSEATGYSHLYSLNARTGAVAALTAGNHEIQDANLSADKKYFYFTSNEVHPGEKHFYRLPVAGGKAERLTKMEGSNVVSLSPDEKTMAILYSYSNKPTELFLQDASASKTAVQITNKAQSAEFSSYAWRDPEVTSFKARDGADVYARIYKPATPDPTKPAVIFVHGAGYLQNAHKWWSSYFREYMFHNLLADAGYYVMDIDYRGSAGYGRDWRTGIYRHMGGKDLTDNEDAAAYLVKNFGVDKNRIGVYGGSYGGFITLMGMFTSPDVFAAGAALRPVTDWANYNHGYTSNILNEPFTDSLAYRKSSPLYFAEGLKGNLLICHGMLDVNVHYQDAVKLSQRLIELHKDNWELAGYPMEDHGFVEPSSWTDEYKRIFKLFETVLKK